MALPPDDAELAYVLGVPRYGGGPNRLRDPATLERVKALLLSRWNCCQVAEEIGYATSRGFSDAFKQIMGERPGAWVRRHGVVSYSRGITGRCLGRRKPPNRTGQIPYPTYAAKKRRARLTKQRADRRRRQRAEKRRLARLEARLLARQARREAIKSGSLGTTIAK